jgi:hypothetical protein
MARKRVKKRTHVGANNRAGSDYSARTDLGARTNNCSRIDGDAVALVAAHLASTLRARHAPEASGWSRAGPRLRPLGLVGALRGLVVLERLRRVDVAERGVPGHELLGGGDVEVLGEHGADRLHLHLPEAG